MSRMMGQIETGFIRGDFIWPESHPAHVGVQVIDIFHPCRGVVGKAAKTQTLGRFQSTPMHACAAAAVGPLGRAKK